MSSAEVWGYFAWSFLDNFEWAEGDSECCLGHFCFRHIVDTLTLHGQVMRSALELSE
jgi:hypothetical protein